MSRFDPFVAHLFQQSTQNSNQPQPSQTVITSTLLSTSVGLGSDRQISTAINTLLFTTTQILTPAPQPSGNGTVGNGTVSGNNTVSANMTTTPRNLPTAPANINGGGQDGAPSPGQAGVGGIYGPNDNYIAAATALKRNAFIIGFVGCVVGGALVVF
jgi:hypothetical protein